MKGSRYFICLEAMLTAIEIFLTIENTPASYFLLLVASHRIATLLPFRY